MKNCNEEKEISREGLVYLSLFVVFIITLLILLTLNSYKLYKETDKLSKQTSDNFFREGEKIGTYVNGKRIETEILYTFDKKGNENGKY